MSHNKHKKFRAKRDELFKSTGACKRCGTDPAVADGTECRWCKLKRLSTEYLGSATRWNELERVLLSQKFRCAYSGRRIDIGLKASIEHVTPIAKLKRRETNIDNIRWVHEEINRMKSDMTLDEFLSACKEVLSFHGYEVRKSGD